MDHLGRTIRIAFFLGVCGYSFSDDETRNGGRPQEFDRVHESAIVIDTHADTTHKLMESSWQFSERGDSNHVDLPRMREGGLDAVFLSIWTGKSDDEATAFQTAVEQIEAVRALTERLSDELILATEADHVREAAAAGKNAILIGVEGGHMIADDLDNLRTFYALGARYMTLTHQFHTNWADSSGTTVALKPLHHGLTPFGEQVVVEMNRLGMMVDVSHASDETFWDALKISTAPMVASHSACRELVDVPRNLSDEMIRAMAAKGGVIQLLFAPMYIDPNKVVNLRERFSAEIEDINRKFENDPKRARRERAKLFERARAAPTTVSHVVDHIDHVIKLVGSDHVGIGGDWDNFSSAGPMTKSVTKALGIKDVTDGLEDVSKLPSLTEEMLQRGYNESTVKKVLGGNLLRLMKEAEETGSRIRAAENPSNLQ
jgi:membrane dipeptidase